MALEIRPYGAWESALRNGIRLPNGYNFGYIEDNYWRGLQVLLHCAN